MMDHMRKEDSRRLYRDEFDLLTIQTRQDLLRSAAEENGMTLKGFKRFERWGRYTYTAIYESDGSEFVFVPGDTVTLGWEGHWEDLDGRTRFMIEKYVKEHGVGPRAVLEALVLRTRSRTIPPMLVEVHPSIFEGDASGCLSSVSDPFSVPTSDEWEYLCGGGGTTLFQWGDSFDFGMGLRYFPDQKGPYTMEEPNFFGIVIASDPFLTELVSDEGPLFRGGDLGGNIITGYGPVIGYLPCSPHFKPISTGPDRKVPERFLVRRIVRLDVPCEDQAVSEVMEQPDEGPEITEVAPGPDTVFSDDRPFPKDYVFCRAIVDDPSVPDDFTVRAQHVFRGLIHWIPAGDWTYAELEDQLRSRARRISDIQGQIGYTMSQEAVRSVRQTFSDIISYYGMAMDVDRILDDPVWNITEEGSSGDYEGTDSKVPEPLDTRYMVLVMGLIERCEDWHNHGEHRKVVEAIESLPESSRDPCLTSVLARAYNNLGGPDDTGPFHKAISLLESVREDLSDDFLWNYRMGYSYYMLDREPEAIPYLQRAKELEPDDEDNSGLLDACVDALSMPTFHRTFRERTEVTWRRFAESMSEIERLLSHPDRRSVEEELLELVDGILCTTFGEVSFEIGHDGERFELILVPERDRVSLFELMEFVRRAPEDVLSRWRVSIGKHAGEGLDLVYGDVTVGSRDVEVLVERSGNFASVTAYCEKLLPLMDEDENRVWWMISNLLEQNLGEIPAMAILNGFSVVRERPQGDLVRLGDIRSRLIEMGFNTEVGPEGYLSTYMSYKLEPIDDPDADWRFDVIAGSSRCPPLVNDYLGNDDSEVDMLHADGAVAGFLVFPLDSFDGDDRVSRILDFREAAERSIIGSVGEDSVVFIGGATGLRHGYIDLIAWDLPRVLQASTDFFEGTDVEWAGFHSFRRSALTLRLVEHEGTDTEAPVILTPEDVDRFQSYVGEIDGRYHAMLNDLVGILNSGIREGRFTRRQVESDLDTALWYAYACLNIGDYEHYWQAAQWMPSSEGSATGCATWFYRYSCALMYCGRLEDARDYAERGILEEPGYPWIWLQAAKMRAHFGDWEGAMEAIARGLELVPGDYEFLTLAEEVEAGLDLDSFEFHWIDPGADAVLQSGEDPDAREKLDVIAGILTDPEGAARFRSAFHPIDGTWEEDSPYCSFDTEVRGLRFGVLFRANIAALSKMDPGRLGWITSEMYEGRWNSYAAVMRRSDPLFNGDGKLVAVIVDRDSSVTLAYRLPNGRDAEVSLGTGTEPIR